MSTTKLDSTPAPFNSAHCFDSHSVVICQLSCNWVRHFQVLQIQPPPPLITAVFCAFVILYAQGDACLVWNWFCRLRPTMSRLAAIESEGKGVQRDEWCCTVERQICQLERRTGTEWPKPSRLRKLRYSCLCSVIMTIIEHARSQSFISRSVCVCVCDRRGR